jgi:hypothetical protein
MKKKKSLFTRLPFFALIFSVYPSLALLSTNILEVDAVVVIRPFLLSLLGACILIFLFRVFFKDWIRASLATTTILVFFFSYGHIARLLVDRFDPDYNRLIQVILYLLFITLIVFAIRWIVQSGANIVSWISSINTIALVLVLFPVIQVFSLAFGSPANTDQPVSTPTPNAGSDSLSSASPSSTIPANVDPGQYPDVYLIVLDGYSRADTLEVLGYDNSEFLNTLEDMGFYVAECSRSNYKHTLLSMSSTFSMDLLWRAIPNAGPTDRNTAPLYEALKHNRVRSDFEQRGYTIVAFQTGYSWDEWTDADIYLKLDNAEINNEKQASFITPFEYIFLRNTAIYPFIENSALAVQRFYQNYNEVNHTLDKLPKVASSIPGPKFVYAHIMSPHTPYIFLPDGSLNTDSRFYNTETGTPSNPNLEAEGYINNVKFLNSRMPGIFSEIIKNSKVPPVIILQGDHGYVIPERRYNNLMAFYFPNGGNEALYPTITPVNTFRLVSNLYFGTDMPLRNDVSNVADVGRPYVQKRDIAFPAICP